MMKTALFVVAMMLLAIIVSPALAQGEAPDLKIRLSRDFGYAGFDNSIQGRFSIHVSDASAFERIEFFIDGTMQKGVDEAPFKLQFHTENFDAASHQIFAIGYTRDGLEVRSNEFVLVFIGSSEVGESMKGFVLPILGLIFIAGLLSTLLPRLLWRKKGYRHGEYGMAGGAICKNCAKPFSRHTLAPNLIAGKLERCPHCGKWQVAPRENPDDLEVAEKLVYEDGASKIQGPSTESEEERLRHQIDDSRYND
jgi:hypothetical protein